MNNKLFSKDEEKRIAEIYSSACSDITAPQELYGKVIDNMTEKKRDINFNWKVAITVAAFMIVILGSNVLVYAATGTGWIGRIMVAMEKTGNQEMTFTETKDSEGKTLYIGYIQDGLYGPALTVTTYDPSVLEGVSFRIEGEKLYVTDAEGEEHQIKIYNQEDGYTAGLVLVTPLPEDSRNNQ